MYTVVERGTPNTLGFRIYYTKDGGLISPFHDIPLFSDESKQYCNMVVEIPRWSNAKMEISKEEPFNPIKQDVKKGKLRFVNNVFPYHGYIWNYGALPQTWEDPKHVDTDTQAGGDNDPLDAVEIGSAVAARGEVKQVKVLGVIAMIDEGETDWKVVVIDKNDPLAGELSDIGDVERILPGYLEATRDWFRIYKCPTGKPMNGFAFDGKWMDKGFADKVIADCNAHWRNLVLNKGVAGDVATKNSTVPNSCSLLSADEANAVLAAQPEFTSSGPEVDPATQNQCFVKRTVSEKVCSAYT